MKMALIYGEAVYMIEVARDGAQCRVTVNGEKTFLVDNCEVAANMVSFECGGKKITAAVAEDLDRKHIAVAGEYFTFVQAKGSKGSGSAGEQKGDAASSPMPGLLVKIAVSIGEQVKAGATLAVVEAMKMQNELRSPRDGTVKKINYKEGEQVDAFVPVVELESQ